MKDVMLSLADCASRTFQPATTAPLADSLMLVFWGHQLAVAEEKDATDESGMLAKRREAVYSKLCEYDRTASPLTPLEPRIL